MVDLTKKILYLLEPGKKFQIFKIVLLMILGGAIETVGIGIILPFVSLLNDPKKFIESSESTYWSNLNLLKNISPSQILIFICIGLIIIFITKNLLLALINYQQINFISRSQIHLSKRLFKEYLYAPYTFHLEKNTADIISYIISEVGQVFNGVLFPALILISELIVVSFVFLLLLFIDPITSLAALLSLSSTIIIFNLYIRKKIHQLGDIRKAHFPMIVKSVNQALGGLKETKVLGREKQFMQIFNNNILTSIHADLLATFARQTPSLFIETIIMVSIVLIVLLVIVQGKSTQSVFPLLSLFAIAALRIMPSAKRISSTLPSINYYKHSVDSIYNEIQILESITKQKKSYKKYKNAKPFQKNISFRNINFSYPNSKIKAIDNISFELYKNKSIAFVGSSGSGKTTMIDILLGLLTPDDGEIRIDGKDFQSHLREWQNQIGYIPQNIFLSDESIKQNIAFGLPEKNISEKQVWAALRAAQLEDFVKDQPNSINTIVGEKGVRLSGGQQQRIGIARAIYHNPEVLVMDEATAALDNTTEQELIKALDSLAGQKTLVFIAHRLTTVKKCDQIFLLKKGRIIATGSYSELLRTSIDFRNMAHAMTE